MICDSAFFSILTYDRHFIHVQYCSSKEEKVYRIRDRKKDGKLSRARFIQQYRKS
jgi:hypothetical protein